MGEDLGKWLVETMRDNGITCLRLSCDSGISMQTIQGIRQGKLPTMQTFFLLLDALGMEMQIVEKGGRKCAY